jgi:hypothetical protein
MKTTSFLLRSTTSRSLLAAFLVSSCALSAPALIVTFDSASSITGNFSAGGIVASGTLAYSATAGLNGQGGAVMPGGSNNNFIYSANAAFDSTPTELTLGVYVKMGAVTTDSSALALTTGISGVASPQSALGFGGAATDGTIGVPRSATGSGTTFTTPQYSLAVSLRYDAASDNYNLVSFNNGSNAGLGVTSTFALTSGNWYYWETDYTYNTISGNYTFTSQLFNSASDGTVGSAVSPLYSQTVANAGLAASANVYGILGTQAGSTRGIVALDTFSIVPEPGTAILAGLGLMVVIGFRRRHA